MVCCLELSIVVGKKVEEDYSKWLRTECDQLSKSHALHIGVWVEASTGTLWTNVRKEEKPCSLVGSSPWFISAIY